MSYRPLSRIISLSVALLGASLPTYGTETEVTSEEIPPQEKTQSEDKKYRQAQDMSYGATLYEYFQGNNFDALSTLLVAKQRDSIKVHRDSAALIEGGISLSFGLHRRAAELFELQLQTGNQDTDSKLHQAAWLKLAELNYLQGDFSLAAKNLEKSGAIDSSTLPLNLALRSEEISTAQEFLKRADLPLSERLLGHINLGAALARRGELVAAAEEYRFASTLATEQDEPSEDILILADKAHIGAGYAMALSEQFSQAQAEFSQVRLHTPWATKALLGLAWSSINSEQYQEGVDALRFLLAEHQHSPAAREARVALPYAYEKQAERNKALSAYSDAATYFESTLQQLQHLQRKLSSEPLADASQFSQSQRYGWLQLAQAAPLLRNNQHFLLPILQSDQFQLRLSELRDLQQMDRVLNDWSQKIPQLHSLIEERHQRRSGIIGQYQSAEFDQQLQIAKQHYRNLNDALAQIEGERDALTLLEATSNGEGGNNSEIFEMLEILQGAEQRYQLLRSNGKGADYQGETLAKARGILLWQASEQYHHRLWQQRKTLQILESSLRDGEKQLGKTSVEVGRAPQLTQLTERLASTAAQLSGQRAAIAKTASKVEAALRRDIIAELEREQSRIHSYQAHTRLAIARLQDASMLEAASQPPPKNSEKNTQVKTQDGENTHEKGNATVEKITEEKTAGALLPDNEGGQSE
ncbi:hypothetical protein [Microbulbifer sp. JMSA008]|uniref:hypothetical protein n=1 Tax=Microbulbifer sp. JMSA008 TaxID=3243373 RepID=UPI004039B959